MTHRARIAAIACPEALIDTDNWPMVDKAHWRDYLNLRPTLGIPALYYVSHIDSTGEPLTEADYAALREMWAHYRQTQTVRRRRISTHKISELGGLALPETKRLGLTMHRPIIQKPFKAWDRTTPHGESTERSEG